MKYSEKFPAIALLISTLLVVMSYYPIFAAILDPGLVFAYGDFSTNVGSGSGEIRKELSIYTFVDGAMRRGNNRFFLLNSFSMLSDFVQFSDSQFTSALILLSLLLGALGIYHIARRFEKNDVFCALLILLLIPFYFMNLWSVERLGHTYIWITYAILPLFLHLGLSYSDKHSPREIILYSLMFGFFGFIPHSFIYLAIIHLALAAYIFLRKGRSALFLLAPLVIFAILNAPIFALAVDVGFEYPIEVTNESTNYLSNYGEMLNLLAFSNNWWPQVPKNSVFDNPFFRDSSIAYFALFFITFALAFRSMSKDQRRLSIILMLAVVAVMVVARGKNSDIMREFINFMVGIGKNQLLGPFREWARIGIIIPVFMITIFSLGVSLMKSRAKNLVVISLGILLLLNLAASPIWIYLHEKYAPLYYDDAFDKLAEGIGKEGKVFWLREKGSRVNATTIDGEAVRNRPPILDSIGSGYPNAIGLHQPPAGLVDALNINHIIKLGNPGGYYWLDCRQMGELQLCPGKEEVEPFSVYKGTILADDDMRETLNYPIIPDYAQSNEVSDYTEFELVGEGGTNGSFRSILIFEGEDFDGDFTTMRDVRASGDEMAVGKKMMKKFYVPHDGSYILAVKGGAGMQAFLSGQRVNLSGWGTGFEKSGWIELEKGQNSLDIFCERKSCALDVAWLYEGEDILEENGTGKVTGYERINPTLWKVSVDSEGPFLLGFAETYGSWEARLGNGTRIKSVKLYNGINGFWIDGSQKDIEIRYTKQDGYEAGLAISLAAFLGCVAGIFLVRNK